MIKHLFLIGPGSVGKSTVAPFLSERLGIPLLDIDYEFSRRIGNIGGFIGQHSYESYVAANHDLFRQLLAESADSTLIVLSSGFLAHERAPEIAALNRVIVKENGTSILLLPDMDPMIAVEIILKRHVTRTYITTPPERERERFLGRLPIYLEFEPDITVYSAAAPEVIADQMLEALNKYTSPVQETVSQR